MEGRTRKLAAVLGIVMTVGLAACTSTAGRPDTATPIVTDTAGEVSGTGSAGPPGEVSSTARTSSDQATGQAPPTASTPVRQSAPKPKPKPKPRTIWTVTDVQPLGQPVPAGTAVLTYVTRDRVMYLEADDAATGKLRWRRSASVGDVDGSMNQAPVIIGNRVVYLRPANSLWSTRVVVADAATGRDLSVSPVSYRVFDPPSACDRLVCFGASVEDADADARYRLDPRTGTISSTTAKGQTDNAIELTDGLFMMDGDSAGKQPDRLSRRASGKQLWNKRLADTFGRYADGDSFWTLTLWAPPQGSAVAARGPLYFGTVGPNVPAGITSVPVSELVRTTAITARDGTVVWSVPGSSYYCLQAVSGLPRQAKVRCRFSADATARPNGTAQRLVHGAVSIEGFDPATGRTRWSIPITAAKDINLAEIGDNFRATFDGRLVVPSRSGPVAVDLTTGRSSPAAGLAVACQRTIAAEIFGAGRPDSPYPFHTGYLFDNCDASGRSIALQQLWPDWIGVDVGPVRIVATSQGIEAVTGQTSIPALPPRSAGSSRDALLTGTNPVARSAAAPQELWSANGFAPVSAPVAAGKLVLLYGSRGNGLTLEAVEAATGRSMWSTPISSGAYGPSIGDRPAVAGTTVLYARPNGDSATIVVADTATGNARLLWDGNYQLTDWPRNCQGDLCLGVYGDRDYLLRVDAATGIFTFENPSGRDASRQGSDGLLHTWNGNDSQIARIQDHRVTFTVPFRSIFPAGQVTSSEAVLLDQRRTFVQASFVRPAAGTSLVHPGRDHTTVGFDATTGKKLWATVGADQDCLPSNQRSDPRPVAVRCQWPAATSAADAGEYIVNHDQHATLQGFDPRAGRTTWALPLGSQQAVASEPQWAGENSMIVTTAKNIRMTVELTTGRTTPAGRYLCDQVISTGASPIDGAPKGVQNPTAFGYDWCSGPATKIAPPAPWPTWVGTQVGDVRVVLTSSGLRGYRQR